MCSAIQSIDAVVIRISDSRLTYAPRLAGRAKELAAAYVEEYEGGMASASALSDLLTFFEAGQVTEYTYLTLTPQGGWYAEWVLQNNVKVSIEFQNSGNARFIMLKPNLRHPGKLDHFSGATTTDSLTEAIRPLPFWTELAA